MGQVCGVGRGLRWKIKQNKSKFLALSMLGSKLFDIPSYFWKWRKITGNLYSYCKKRHWIVLCICGYFKIWQVSPQFSSLFVPYYFRCIQMKDYNIAPLFSYSTPWQATQTVPCRQRSDQSKLFAHRLTFSDGKDRLVLSTCLKSLQKCLHWKK